MELSPLSNRSQVASPFIAFVCVCLVSSVFLGAAGTVVTTDVTYLLEKQGYFGSYNIAFAPLIRDLSGES
jgi:hypothetical protein